MICRKEGEAKRASPSFCARHLTDALTKEKIWLKIFAALGWLQASGATV
jgi:hypothetical protein